MQEGRSLTMALLHRLMRAFEFAQEGPCLYVQYTEGPYCMVRAMC